MKSGTGRETFKVELRQQQSIKTISTSFHKLQIYLFGHKLSKQTFHRTPYKADNCKQMEIYTPG
jgi:hypothetical protein